MYTYTCIYVYVYACIHIYMYIYKSLYTYIHTITTGRRRQRVSKVQQEEAPPHPHSAKKKRVAQKRLVA
jgi:hypothetical protein